MPNLNERSNFKYVDKKNTKSTHGEKGVFLIATGVTPQKRRAILDVVLVKEKAKRSYWSFLVRLWRKCNVELIVANDFTALYKVIRVSNMRVRRQ
ncbi:hypothetical protein HS7_03010 [Sulfolobales archaeon HS-7]|nr:hypothetical protein HS7_03010 [Sulfolobales archaeon HS-7]